jgi:hypothetical protein
MKRNEWEFEYTAANLAKAARDQSDFRAERTEFWKGKKEEVMRKVKESGLTVHEDLSLGYSSNNINPTKAFGGGAQVLVDPTLQRELNECVERIRLHEAATKEYAGWAEVLSASPEKRVALHADDWLYFFSR